MSKRHNLVDKLLKTAFVFAALFGASSLIYTYSKSELSKSLEDENAYSALSITLAIDKISLNEDIKKSEAECNQLNIKT